MSSQCQCQLVLKSSERTSKAPRSPRHDWTEWGDLANWRPPPYQSPSPEVSAMFEKAKRTKTFEGYDPTGGLIGERTHNRVMAIEYAEAARANRRTITPELTDTWYRIHSPPSTPSAPPALDLNSIDPLYLAQAQAEKDLQATMAWKPWPIKQPASPPSSNQSSTHKQSLSPATKPLLPTSSSIMSNKRKRSNKDAEEQGEICISTKREKVVNDTISKTEIAEIPQLENDGPLSKYKIINNTKCSTVFESKSPNEIAHENSFSEKAGVRRRARSLSEGRPSILHLYR